MTGSCFIDWQDLSNATVCLIFQFKILTKPVIPMKMYVGNQQIVLSRGGDYPEFVHLLLVLKYSIILSNNSL